MANERLEQQIEIMKEWLIGTDKQLQHKNKNSDMWCNTSTPDWNFKKNKYRLVDRDFVKIKREKNEQRSRNIREKLSDTNIYQFFQKANPQNIITLNSAFYTRDERIAIPLKLLNLLQDLDIQDDEFVNFCIMINKKKQKKEEW